MATEFWVQLFILVIGILVVVSGVVGKAAYDRGYTKGLDDGRRYVWIEAVSFGYAKEHPNGLGGHAWDFDRNTRESIDFAISVLQEKRKEYE